MNKTEKNIIKLNYKKSKNPNIMRCLTCYNHFKKCECWRKLLCIFSK